MSGACLVVIAGVHLAVPAPRAPRLNVRWAADLSPAARVVLEQELALAAGAPEDGRTWAYDLRDTRPAAVRRLIAHPAVEDTHRIDRQAATVLPDAPAGFTPLARGAGAWRNSPLLAWLALACFSLWLTSGAWLGRR